MIQFSGASEPQVEVEDECEGVPCTDVAMQASLTQNCISKRHGRMRGQVTQPWDASVSAAAWPASLQPAHISELLDTNLDLQCSSSSCLQPGRLLQGGFSSPVSLMHIYRHTFKKPKPKRKPSASTPRRPEVHCQKQTKDQHVFAKKALGPGSKEHLRRAHFRIFYFLFLGLYTTF